MPPAPSPDTTTPTPLAECSKRIVVAYKQSTKGNYDYDAGKEQGTASNQSSSGSTQVSPDSGDLLSRNRASSMKASSASPVATPTAANVAAITGTFAQPLTAYWQLSGEVQAQNSLLSSLTKQTNATLSSVVQQQVAQQAGRIVPGGLGTSTTSTRFTTVDADTLDRLLPSTFRGYSDPASTLTNAAQAFDGTDVLDLTPFNPTVINSVTEGVKVASVNPLFNSFGQRLGLAGFGWFHDATRGESGTIIHVDQDLSTTLSIGVSQVVGNTVTPPTNRYVAYPNPENAAYPIASPIPNPILHSTNTVVGALAKLGGGDNDESKPVQLFGRLGTNGLGRDWLGAISASDLGSGRPIDSNGTSLSLAAMAGYRAISYDYAPLLTNYDPFAGNQIYFGRGNISVTSPKTITNSKLEDHSGTQTYTLSVAGVYAVDGGLREYTSLGISPSIPLATKPNPNQAVLYSITGTYQHSYISSTVLAREAGSLIVPPGPLNLLDNDNTSLNFQLQNADGLYKTSHWTFTATAGLSFVHTPSCSAAAISTASPSCSSSYAKKVTWSINAGSEQFVLYATSGPGSNRTNPTSVSPSIPSNTIVTTAVVAYHLCDGNSSTAWGIEPSLTYKNNIAQDGSSFQPGTLLELGADIGPANGIKELGNAVLSVAYQNAINSEGTPLTLKDSGFSVTLTSASQAIWQAHKSKSDPCLTAKGSG